VRHLLSIDELSVEDLREVLRITPSFAEVGERRIAKVPALRGQTVALLFYEDSTRTRLSFEVAAKRLSADTLNVSVSTSSVNKGESLRDTAETIEAMGIDAVVVRHRSSGVPWQLTKWLDAAVINAGDGWHQHPTQALLDCFTLQQKMGDIAGSHIVIVGDIKHSRVARSDVAAFTMLGATVTLVAPPTLLPPAIHTWPVSTSHDLDATLPTADAVYLLRMQRERMNESLVPDLREYTTLYGLTADRAALLDPTVPILHPGPMNRGVEIAADVPDLEQVVVVDQVRNGVAVRMAVLFLLLGSGTGEIPLPEPIVDHHAGIESTVVSA
jgi:aspartate carbamoyltransferase catalytic subunit